MEEQKDKRVLNIELSNEVKKVSITARDGNENVVMRQELSEDELKLATGGGLFPDVLCKGPDIIRHPNRPCPLGE